MAKPVLTNTNSSNLVWGSDGAFWITSGSIIDRVTTTGSITSYPIPFAGYTMGAGADGNLWIGSFRDFKSQESAEIARFDLRSHTTTIFPVPRIYDQAKDLQYLDIISLVLGPDGNMWFTEEDRDTLDIPRYLGTITPTGHVRIISLGEQEPADIAFGADGNVWFSDDFGNHFYNGVLHYEITRLTP